MSRCQDDIFPRIELIPSFVLSSDNTNCKNEHSIVPKLFDELSVHKITINTSRRQRAQQLE